MDSKAEAAVFKQVSETKLKYFFQYNINCILLQWLHWTSELNNQKIKRKLFAVPILEYLTDRIQSVFICSLGIFLKYSNSFAQRIEELRNEVKARENEVIQRDKVITELRLRLPASVERDRIIDKVTATVTSAMPHSDGYESQQAYKVAQSTVHSLQVCDS